MTRDLLPLHCAHDKPVYAKCEQCEEDVKAGKSTGFTPPELPPSKEPVTLRHIAIIAHKTEYAAEDRIDIIQKLLAAEFVAQAIGPRAGHEPKSDQCEVCAKPLPPVGAWSMPSCPDCQELLAGLGEMMADLADREQTIKADWIGRAINLICARSSQPPSPDALDAERYRFLRAAKSSDCITVETFGRPDGVMHLAGDDLDAAVDAARATSTKGEG